jgi:HSP20 family protein
VSKQHKGGLEGLFRGIASILQTANDIAVRAGDDGTTPIEVERSASVGLPGTLRTMYGASLRIGARVAPPRRRPRTVRQRGEREPIIEEGREPIADVFDEGDHVVVIAELPGVALPAIRWSVRQGRCLEVRAESSDRKYVKDLELPCLVNEQAATCNYANGVMELRLWKV